MSCGVGHRCSSDLALLCLWHRQEATAWIRPLDWEPPYALKRQKKKLMLDYKPKIEFPLEMTGLLSFLKFSIFYHNRQHVTFVFQNE